MHELSLIGDLVRKLEAVSREQGGARVLGVKVTLGALSHISAEHFREHFLEATRGTVADGARLEVIGLSDAQDPRAQDVLLQSVEVEA